MTFSPRFASRTRRAQTAEVARRPSEPAFPRRGHRRQRLRPHARTRRIGGPGVLRRHAVKRRPSGPSHAFQHALHRR